MSILDATRLDTSLVALEGSYKIIGNLQETKRKKDIEILGLKQSLVDKQDEYNLLEEKGKGYKDIIAIQDDSLKVLHKQVKRQKLLLGGATGLAIALAVKILFVP